MQKIQVINEWLQQSAARTLKQYQKLLKNNSCMSIYSGEIRKEHFVSIEFVGKYKLFLFF